MHWELKHYNAMAIQKADSKSWHVCQFGEHREALLPRGLVIERDEARHAAAQPEEEAEAGAKAVAGCRTRGAD